VKLLFVHEVSYRKKVIFEMHEFPELLAARGHDITFFDFDEGAKFWDGALAPRKAQIQGRVNPQVTLTIRRAFQFGVPGVDRVLATFTSWWALWRVLSGGKFDAIVLLAVPTFGIQTIALARVFGVPVVFRALDVSHKIRTNIFELPIKGIEKFIYKRADLVLGNNPAMTEYCSAMGKRILARKPSETLLAPLDTAHFENAISDLGLRESLGIKPGDKVITYMGSFFYFSGLSEVVEAFAAWLSTSGASDVKLLLIGGGEKDHELRQLVAGLGISESVIFTGFVSYGDLPKFLALSTVAINPLKKSLVSDTAFPHKVPQYLATGLPVVSTRLNGLHAVFGDEAGIVWLENPSDLLSFALAIATNGQAHTKASAAALLAVKTKMRPASVVQQLENHLSKLIREHKAK
jgi:glycosyltransferase involved in cell wall biosynthesis